MTDLELYHILLEIGYWSEGFFAKVNVAGLLGICLILGVFPVSSVQCQVLQSRFIFLVPGKGVCSI